MIDIAMCIARDHDPWLVMLAVLVCCLGAFAVVQMLGRAQATAGVQRVGWLFLTAVGAGATIWCTHFVAMLAYRAGVPVQLDPVMTIVSLIVAILGTGLGFTLATWRRGIGYSVAGGALVGLAISTMHYVGMAAYRVDGLVVWQWPYVTASVLCSIVFAGGALAALRLDRLGRYRVPTGIGLLVLSIATLHFVAMTALRIIPLRLSETPLDTSQTQALGLATAMVGLVVIAAGVFAALIDRATRSDAIERLNHMAMTDALTGLPNRAAFRDELQRQLDLAHATGTRLGVVAIDLDRFSEINDQHGQKAGDRVLAVLAQRMRNQMRRHETVARLSGDRFTALLRFDEPAQLIGIVARLEAALKAPVAIGPVEMRIGAGIGIAEFPRDAQDAETLVNNADLALLRAKSQDSPEPCYYDAPLDEAVRERRELAGELRQAIADDALELHYQPQTSVNSHKVTGYEALVRWAHPTRGAISPELFVPIAEESGLIPALGEWVMRRACTDAMGWEGETRVAVNVSPVQLADTGLPQLFHQIMVETGLPPRRLEIELTESAIMTNREQALHVLRRIKALGVRVALDDFGTGYSSLETLRMFAFDKIKLDRSFVSELDSPQAIAIIRAVLALGRSLSIPVLAEGIETEAQLAVLRREGCDEVQGFLFGHPEPRPTARRDAA